MIGEESEEVAQSSKMQTFAPWLKDLDFILQSILISIESVLIRIAAGSNECFRKTLVFISTCP